MEKNNHKETEILSRDILIPINSTLVNTVYQTELPLDLYTKLLTNKEASLRLSLENKIRNFFTQNSTDNLLSRKEQKESILDEITEFIEHDPNNARIILYLPFELFPDLNYPSSHIEEKCAKTIHNAWFKLLFESDVRANFIDGDDLQTKDNKLIRTRKSAHLIPELLSRKIINKTEILNLQKINNDIEIEKSIKEGLSVGKIMENDTKIDPINIEEIAINFDSKIEQVNLQHKNNSQYLLSIDKKRSEWEKSTQIDELIDDTAKQLANKLITNQIIPDTITKKFNNIVLIRSLTKALEIFSFNNEKIPLELKNILVSKLQKLWKEGTQLEKEEVFISINHLVHLNVISIKISKEMGIEVPDLSLSLPINIDNFFKKDGESIAKAAEKIAKNPFLKEKIFPFILVFGSRLKGYSNLSADFDFAVFLKPNTNWKERNKILSTIKKDIPEIGNSDRLLEFWTEIKNDSYNLRSTHLNTENVVGAKQIHFIFGGTWIGCGKEMKKIYGDLSRRYLDLSRFGNQKQEARRILLRQIELDILQYRLMHKGFRKIYPRMDRSPLKNGELIDWKSDFWDQGYRKIATLLFLNKVFLPDLSEN